jgi:hypothetical protein
MKILHFLALSLVLAPLSALAQDDRPPDESESTTGPEDTKTPEIIVEGEVAPEQRRVCEMQTTTGSIMPRRVCRTVAQIEEDERVARESLEIIKRDRDTRSFIQLSQEAGR